VAKTIATIGGVALVPGVSKNRRWYTDGIVSRAAGRLQERIDRGDAPAVMLSFHGAGDNSREITASLSKASLDDRGRLRFEAGIADTAAGRDIAALADTSDGKPAHLKPVSIRGYWLGEVRKVTGPDGQPAETAEDVDIAGIDFTKDPGVTGAQVDTFAWAGDSKTETSERVYITESVMEAHVTTITEEAPPDAAEADDAKTDAPAGTTYADPGYLKDGKKRHPLNSAKRIRAAWSYISQKANAAQYSASQLKRIKGKIKAAMGRIGATVTAEGWAIWPAEQVAESDAVITEYAGDTGGGSGSFSVCASNGPLSISMSSWCVDPADLDLILRAVAAAAADALKAIDPDMDGDMDIPGADSEDTDHDGGESAPAEPDEATETSPADEAGDTAATAAPTEEEAVSDATTTETAAAAPASVTFTTEQFDAFLARMAPPAPAAAAPAATEAVQPAATAVAVVPAASVAETAEQRETRITALVEAGVAAAAAAQGLAVAETDEQMVQRLIEAQLTPLRQAAAEKSGTGTARKGLLDNIAEQGPGTAKMLAEASGEDLALLAGAAYAPRR
jgi:DNA-binding protein YbaB